MNLQVTFKHMDTSPTLKSFIEERCETLMKYFHGKVSLHWTLSMERQNRVAHCRLTGSHMDYFGEGSSEDFKLAIDMALDRLEKQVKKHKEIVKDHLHRHGHDAGETPEET